MKRILTIAAAVLFGTALSAQQAQPIPIDPAVRIGQLENGLTYYIRHNGEPAGQANFYIAQKVGSILEDENQRGLAHFLEHMCFNGTKTFPGNGIINYCESIGVKFGADLNAYTSIDETVYNIDNVPVAKVPSSIDSCLWILHDWADGLLLTDGDIDNERGVIHEEWRTRNDANIRAYEKALPMMYPDGNRYGHRLPIGLMSVVDNFPCQVLRDYYEKWYRPDQQGVVVVGDIDVDAVEARIKDIFGAIAKAENPAQREYFEVPDNEEPIICITTDAEQPYAISRLFLKHDAIPAEAKSYMDYLVYDYVITAAQMMVNARIQEMLQSPQPPFIQAEIIDDDYFIAKTKKAFTGAVVSSETAVAEGICAVYREMLRATRNGFTESEYERAKAQILATVESSFNQREKRKSADFCREYVRHFIDNEPIPGIENELAICQQLAPMIPVEAVNQIVGSLVGKGNLVLFCQLPLKEGVTYPDEAQMASLLASVEAEEIAPYVEEVSDEPLIASLPEPGKVRKVKDSKFGYKAYTLSNGATVYLKHTDFNAGEVLLSAGSFGGTTQYPSSPALKALDDVIGLGGLGNFSKTDLVKVLAGKKASATASVNAYQEFVTGKCTPKDIETMFQLCYLNFTALREDPEAFESWRNRERASIANRDADPMTAVSDSMKKTIYVQSERVLDLTVEELDALDYGSIMSIARERFSNAADFSFVITGNYDEQTIIPLIEQYIGSLPSAGKKEKIAKKALTYSKGRKDVLFDREMASPMTSNFFFYSGKTRYSVKNDIAFDLAMSSLSVVLLEEIREKEGGTYGIGAYGSMSAVPREEAYIEIPYQTNPDRYEYLNDRIRQIVADFAQNGPSEENLAKGKEYMSKKYKEGLAQNSFYQSALRFYLMTGEDTVTGYEDTLDSVTTEDVRKVVASLLKQGNCAEVIMNGVESE